MLNEIEIKKTIDEYFEYIKEVYLITFDKILNEETKEKIKTIASDIIEIDLESEFKIKLRNKITFCLNIHDFIKNNNFEKEDFKDINEEGLKKINYYIQNKDNVVKLAKDSLLENMILYFLGNNNLDVITLGTVNLISNLMAEKYNLVTLNNYPKENEVVERLITIIGDKKFYKAMLNNQINELESYYERYASTFENEISFKKIIQKLNDEYSNYGKNKDKVYYVDSLYYYQKIDYSNILNKMDKDYREKEKKLDIMYSRLESIIDCMRELERYKIVSSNDEKVYLYYSQINLKRIVKKINEEKNIDNYYDEAIEMEEKLKPLVKKIWMYYLSNPITNDNDQNWYLVETLTSGYKKKNNRYVTANLITNDKILLPTDDNRYQYGFIYRIKENSVIYAAPDNIVYKEYENEIVEIEEQNYSNLLTPRNLLMNTIKNNKKYNSVLIDKTLSDIVGIFCITDGTEENISYQKALELKEKFELPLIKIIKND